MVEPIPSLPAMHGLLRRGTHPAGFAAARQHDAKTEQQSANDRIRASPHNFRCNAQLHVAENTNSADRHAENNRFRHMGASGDHRSRKAEVKQICARSISGPNPTPNSIASPSFGDALPLITPSQYADKTSIPSLKRRLA